MSSIVLTNSAFGCVLIDQLTIMPSKRSINLVSHGLTAGWARAEGNHSRLLSLGRQPLRWTDHARGPRMQLFKPGAAASVNRLERSRARTVRSDRWALKIAKA
ncbi:hypothetical protein WDZ92_29695 [Nostoc sp. NIES-2111]